MIPGIKCVDEILKCSHCATEQWFCSLNKILVKQFRMLTGMSTVHQNFRTQSKVQIFHKPRHMDMLQGAAGDPSLALSQIT